MSFGVVVLGAGHAGVQLAASLRQLGYRKPVLLVSDEAGLPYQRPPLSKEFLALGAAEQRTLLRPKGFYDLHDIELIAGHAAVSVDRESRIVEFDDATRRSYDHLVLATGARPRDLRIAGRESDGVSPLHTYDQAHSVRGAIASAGRVVVIGGGFIGLETAAAAIAHGATVVVLEAKERVMGRVVTPEVSSWFTDLHSAAGVAVRLNSVAAELVARETGHVSAVVLGNGERIDADAVITGIGIVPNDDLAAAAGLETRDGIVVDQYLRTTDPAVFAVGDCARLVNVTEGIDRRLESVQNAGDQARTVAATIMGGKRPYDSVPWFWTTQFDCKLQIAGIADEYDTAVRRDGPAGSFSVFCFADGRLVATESVDATKDHLAARKLLKAGRPVTPDDVADPSRELKDLLPAIAP